MIRFEIHANGAESLEAYWNALFAAPSRSLIFVEGFESADTSIWSSVIQ